jgi:tetratricopeptide (TPR) repeat protein
MLLGAMLADPHLFGLSAPLSWIVPQVVLLLIVALFWQGMAAQRRTGRLMLEAFEAVQLQSWDQAEAALTQLLARPIRLAQPRAESLLALAAVAEAQGQYDAAQRVYERVIEEKAADALQLHTAWVALAAVMLRTGQTADAVALIDRLTRADIPEPLKAQIELVSLFRELVMGQAQDHLEAAERRRQLFREHLGTRAGFGYGLLAAAFDRANLPEQARRFWHDATLLVRPAELLRRFRELESVAARYPRAEYAL